MRKVQVIVQFRGGPDLAGFHSSVIRGRMLHEMRFPTILKIEFQIFQNSWLIAFDGEMVMRLAQPQTEGFCQGFLFATNQIPGPIRRTPLPYGRIGGGSGAAIDP